jgi:hypothetical protein
MEDCRSGVSQLATTQRKNRETQFQSLGQEMLELRTRLGRWVLAWDSIVKSDCVAGFQQGMRKSGNFRLFMNKFVFR